ncbi:MAG TPA: hypothetical protein VKJ45_02865 [Blastocatellia bacterium]|nr:hypothetical protein [Blastocatellia bacterium]
MSKWQLILVCWSVVALAGAEYVRHLQLADRTQMLIGAVEVALAIGTGIGFGIATIGNRKNDGSSGK